MNIMSNKSTLSKTTKPPIKKGTKAKFAPLKKENTPKKAKITATKTEVKAAGDKAMKKYSVAIKKLADR